MKKTKYNIADAALILLDRSRIYSLRHFDQSCLILTDWAIDEFERVIDHEIGVIRSISQPGDKRHSLLSELMKNEGLLARRARLRCLKKLGACQC